jgi:4-hydroxythreonine-4-phosphate dehydrogenase
MRIGISLGDPTGIGPEVTLKALAALPPDHPQFLLLGNPAQLRELSVSLGMKLRLDAISDPTHQSAPIAIFNPLVSGDATRPADAALAWLKTAGELCLRGQLDSMVTAPVHKESIARAGHRFIGQTEFLSELAGVNDTVMMLLGQDACGRWLRVALATVHVALRDVPVTLSPGKIQLAIRRAAEACQRLGLSRARVGVCGLNPHCGEGGEFGDEEPRLIEPAIAASREGGIVVAGPISGDTVFHHALNGDYDAVVAMYHDQGLAPLKTVAFDTGVNWTLGLPFIRTSPDHGTARDIAGKGIANPSSMICAIRLAKQLASR